MPVAISNILHKYGAFINIAARQTLAAKTVLIGSIFLLLVLLLTYNQLWLAIGQDTAEPTMNATFLWYLLFGEMIILSTPKIERILEQDIKDGTLAYYLNKPISFFAMRFCENLSTMSLNFLALGIFGTFTVWLLTPTPPFSWQEFPLIVALVYFSATINLLIFAAIGFTSLWLEQVRILSMTVQKLAFILGGAIFPFSIYPEWFIDFARYTPFYAIYYLTIKLSYDFSYAGALQAFCLNLLWLGLILGFIWGAYKHLQKKVNIYGG